MKLLIFGATGRTGRHLVSGAIDARWDVHAVGRSRSRLAELPDGIGVAEVDLFDAQNVADIVKSIAPDVIVSAIGGSAPGQQMVDEIGNNAITGAAARSGVRRLLQISSLACGDSRPYASERIIAAIGPVLDAKTQAEDVLRRTGLDWTIIRPGGLTDGDATGSGAVYDDPRVHGRISRVDLAAVVLRCVAASATVHRTLSCVDRTTLPAEPHDVREFAVQLAA